MKKQKVLIILLLLLVIFKLSFVVGIGLAVNKTPETKSKYKFKVNIEAGAKVSASIKGWFYQNDIFLGTVGPVILPKTAGQQTENTLDYLATTTVGNAQDIVCYIFSIANTTKETAYTDLYVKPTYSVDGYSNLITNLTYSTNGASYDSLQDDYLIVNKNKTVYIKAELMITESTYNVTIDGIININLFTEDGLIANND